MNRTPATVATSTTAASLPAYSACEAPEPHQCVADVAIELAKGTRLGLGTTPLAHMPLFAKLAIERLDASNELRTAAQLDELMQAYAHFYRLTVDIETCAAAHHICTRRFWDFQPHAPRR
jgi:hypothetical protein